MLQHSAVHGAGGYWTRLAEVQLSSSAVATRLGRGEVSDAIEMARWSRGAHHEDLRCHSDAGSQFTSIRYGERLAEIGATPSIGTVGDSYDCQSVSAASRKDEEVLAGAF